MLSDSARQVRFERMQESHLSAVEELENTVFSPPFNEALEVHEARFRLAPSTCFVAIDGVRVAGFLIAHPWIEGTWPAMGEVVTSVPDSDEVIYLHSCVVDPRYRGLKIAENLWACLLDACGSSGTRLVQLVAVDGAQAYWERLGFTVDAERKPPYGERAFFMTRRV